MLSPVDGQFGPQFPGQFEFTLLFEHVLFDIIPGSVAVLAFPFYLRMALRQAKQAYAGYLLWLKLAIGLALLGVQTASLAMWQQPEVQSGSATAASVMAFLSSLCVMSFLYINHIYCLRPPGFLSVFLTVTALLDIAMTRSYYRRPDLHVIAPLQTSAVVFKFALVLLEEVSKRALLRSEALRSSVAAETMSGFWNRVLFGWFTKTLLFGFKNELTMENLPSIEEEMNVRGHYDRFVHQWNKGKATHCCGGLYKLIPHSEQDLKIWPFDGSSVDFALANCESIASPVDVCWTAIFSTFPAVPSGGCCSVRRQW